MIAQTFLLGLAYMLAPGPVMIETVRRSVRSGMRGGVAVQCGAVGGALLYALLFVSGVGNILVAPGVKSGMGILGAGLLLYLGGAMVCDRRSIGRIMDAAQLPAGLGEPGRRFWQAASVGMLLIVINPYSLVFWFSVGNTMLNTSPGALASFLLGSLLGCAVVALAAGQLRTPWLRQQLVWVWIGCAVVLLVLGAQLGFSTLVTIAER